ncbi:hypothetical protein P5673_004936 [Acropora cervicornis]|uniref:Uncharacterized protein n=1 Tax=Acropora cervicornis TaxID=6130 RepID=A0AAD9QZX1_ACRCE|nr:hypothetical protein P5673_004936 [Acropora cervicornis]
MALTLKISYPSEESVHASVQCYILPHLEYCSPLLLGINKTLVNKLEAANYYALKVLLNVGKDVDYNSILSKAGMNSLEFRRYEQSLL